MKWLAMLGLFATGCGAVAAGPCSTLGECDCFRRADCNMVKETCWCPSVCGQTQVACLECTATKFIRCEDKK